MDGYLKRCVLDRASALIGENTVNYCESYTSRQCYVISKMTNHDPLLQASPDLRGAPVETVPKPLDGRVQSQCIMTTWALQEWGEGNCDPKRDGWPAA